MNDTKKSHINYKTNLNFKIGKKYQDRLITYGLLKSPKSEN
jgi:predicted transcriptional regulator